MDEFPYGSTGGFVPSSITTSPPNDQQFIPQAGLMYQFATPPVTRSGDEALAVARMLVEKKWVDVVNIPDFLSLVDEIKKVL